MYDIVVGVLTIIFWILTAALIKKLPESKHEKLITFLYFTYAIIYMVFIYFLGANYGK